MLLKALRRLFHRPPRVHPIDIWIANRCELTETHLEDVRMLWEDFGLWRAIRTDLDAPLFSATNFRLLLNDRGFTLAGKSACGRHRVRGLRLRDQKELAAWAR